LITHQGQRPIGHSGIKFGKGASAHKFPVPFWKVCVAFDVAGICWQSDMDMDCTSFTPWAGMQATMNKLEMKMRKSLFLLLSKHFVHVRNNLYSILLTNIWKLLFYLLFSMAFFSAPSSCFFQTTSINTKRPPQNCQKSRPIMLFSCHAYL